MPLVTKSKASRLVLSLSLSVLSASCLGNSAGAQTKDAEPNGSESKATETKAAQSARSTTTVSVPAKRTAEDIAKSQSDFEEQLKAQAIAEQARQNQSVQHYDASRVYLSSGNLEMAELEIQAAIMDGPKVRAYHRDYCVLSILRGHPMRAVAEAMMVVGLGDPIPLSDKQMEKLKGQGCKLHYRRGLELAVDKKWKEAITEFQWALEYRPNNATVLRSMAFANASMGNIELAEKQYGSSFAADPADAYGHADFAYLLAETGKGSEALKQLQEAVKLQPKVAALHIDLGWMAESKGDIGEAEGEFAEAVKLSPKHASLWTHLGKLLARQGKDEEAAHAYKTALALDPQASDAEHGLESLKAPAHPVHPAESGSNGGQNPMPPKFIKKDS